MVAAPKKPEPWESPATPASAEVVYPDSDGQPMADNTRQWERIALLKENLDAMLADFVAGDLLWYPVEGRPEIRVAPDVMVCLGRPKGYRGSYMQFREDGVAPAVVFELLSPGNTVREMTRKGAFYQHHGAREMIVVDPDEETGWALVRGDSGEFEEVPSLDGWTSPTLGIRFAREEGELAVYRPDGARFLSFRELESKTNEAEARADQEAARADKAVARADQAVARADQAVARADQAAARAERLAAQLAALGIDPE